MLRMTTLNERKRRGGNFGEEWGEKSIRNRRRNGTRATGNGRRKCESG